MKALHARLVKLGLDSRLRFVTQIIKAYGSKALPDAQKLFDECPNRDIILWNSFISLHARSDQPFQALNLFSLLHSQSFPLPNHFALATAAHACAAASSIVFGQILHACIVKHGFLSNVVVGTALLDMYAKCYAIDFSKKMFDEMPEKNLVTWNALIFGNVLNGLPVPGLEFFYRMIFVEHIKPDEFSFATALSACGSGNDLPSGKQIHAYVVRSGFEEDLETACSVCSMYMHCGDVPGAETLLKNRADCLEMDLIVIKGYYLNGRYFDMLRKIGHNLMQTLVMDFDLVSYVLSACASLSLIKLGRQVHGIIITSNLCQDYFSIDADVVGCALMDMYGKCGVIEDAQKYYNLLTIPNVAACNSLLTGYVNGNLLEQAKSLFKKMPEKNVISWTSLISGYVRSGLPNEAFAVLAKMYNQVKLVRGNCFTFSAALDACALLASLDLGKQIHVQFVRTSLQNDDGYMVVETALVNAYSKSGNLDYARRVFDRMRKKNVLSWTSMIMGFAINGHGSQALNCFNDMVNAGEEPNEVTFVAVLTACSRCGHVEEGLNYFKLMKEMYGIAPKADHYTCIVDLLGRSGKLVDAYRLMTERHESVDGHDAQQLGALLNGCLLHGNVEMIAMVAKELGKKELTPETCVSLSNVYASVDMWEQAYGVRQELKDYGVIKKPGQSVVSVRG